MISTAATAPKVAAVIACPEVAWAIDGVVDEYLAAARKSMGADAVAEFGRQVRRTYDQVARIAITPRWVRFYDFGVGRVPGFLARLVNRDQP